MTVSPSYAGRPVDGAFRCWAGSDDPALPLQAGERREERPVSHAAVQTADLVEQLGQRARPPSEGHEDSKWHGRVHRGLIRLQVLRSAGGDDAAGDPGTAVAGRVVTWSSSAAWMITALPSASKRLTGPAVSVASAVVTSRCPTPAAIDDRFGRSPACAPVGLAEPMIVPEWVVMPARGRERRRRPEVAASDSVQVDAMKARGARPLTWTLMWTVPVESSVSCGPADSAPLASTSRASARRRRRARHGCHGRHHEPRRRRPPPPKDRPSSTRSHLAPLLGGRRSFAVIP